MATTVGQNEQEMRDLAVEAMQESYRAADKAAKEGRLADAERLLERGETWRQRARQHGARV